jgi:hypothetical protein
MTIHDLWFVRNLKALFSFQICQKMNEYNLMLIEVNIMMQPEETKGNTE